jgi:hypothetical protein
MVVLTSLLAAGFSIALADDLTGSSSLLCSAVQATVCTEDGDCTIGPPWNWNIPQFIEVDLAAKVLRTTKASREERVTPIKSLDRTEGSIFVQGAEKGRAFSFVIDETSGQLSAAVAADGMTISVFGACTTMPVGR